MKHFFWIIIAVLFVIFSYTGRVYAKSPNIVLILADDLGFTDTQPYGSEIQTPNISKLADEGVLFSNYHTGATCAPSRAMLMTGVDSHRAGVPEIPEAITPEMAEHDNYQGTLSHRVVTVATLLRDAGYHTYLTGKWHLGKTPDLLPSQRGFERTVAMLDTGADNWEKKHYSPLNVKANWYADGKEIDLPDDFYSSKFYIDKAIEFIESNRGDEKPFFSYIPFQAVHIPVQAPQEFSDRYKGKYEKGWQALRARRLKAVKKLGLVPENTRLADMPSMVEWNSLSQEQKRYESRKMEVYAGMVEAMDHHIGRFIRYLKETDQYDNTIFVFTSDNGPQISDVFSRTPPEALYLRLWMKNNGYNMDYETLGTRGSFVYMGPSFASAAASPLAYYKFHTGEGGLRVPMIIAGGHVAQKGTVSNALTFVTDITPTILEMAGVAQPRKTYRGREVEPIIGKSLLPIATGTADRVYGADESVGHESSGSAALFKGDYKLVKNSAIYGDKTWRLYNIARDPGESTDLKEQMPELFEEMMAGYRDYETKNGVQPVPADYNYMNALSQYSLRKQVREHALLYITAGILILALLFWLIRSRLKRRGEIPDFQKVTIKEKVVDKTLRPFMFLAGLMTMGPVMIIHAPEAGLMKLFQLKLVAEYTLAVQHWGLMIFLLGLLMVVSAFRTGLIFPVMLYSALSKAGMVVLTISNANHRWVEGFLQPALFDFLCVVYAIVYFQTQRRKRKREQE
ncbi:MAG: sulfatase-like hydrolase/transferase [Proteobacteria bacterium]|nr:sulfatase-like hydrolase/transferase [Pseudomonadota bacterium]